MMEMKKITAFAVCSDQMADSVGTAEDFILWNGQDHIIVKRSADISRLLAERDVQTLVCGGIGNCLRELLEQKNIQVIPGIEGFWREAAAALQTGTLVPGANCTCTEHGRICGDCPGKF